METVAEESNAQELPPPIEVDEAPPAPAPARKLTARKLAPVAVQPAPAPVRTPSVQRQMKSEDEVALKDWLDSIAADGQIKVAISRKSPRIGPRGEQISGSLETVEGPVDDEYIRETWGGGEFSLKVMTPQGPNGAFRYFIGRTLKIAGDPKMHGRSLSDGGASPAPISAGTDSLSERAFESMERNAERERLARERADQELRANANNRTAGLDADALARINAPLYAQLAEAQRSLAEMQAKMIEVSTRPPARDEFRDQLMMRAVDGEGRKLEDMRTMYEARLDKLRDNHDDQLKRMHDSHQDDIKRLEARHERELHSLKSAIEQGGKGIEQAMLARIEAKGDIVGRLERENAALQAKIATLEATKNQSIGDKATELITIKEALDGLGGGDDGDEKWYEKLIGAVGNSEAAIGLINKLSGGGPPAQGQQQIQLPPPGVPFQTGDGNVYVRDANGNTTILDQNKLRARNNIAAARARKKQQAAPPADAVEAGLADDDDDDDGDEGEEGGNDAPVGRPPDAKEMKMAISFMENALARNAPPEDFARTAIALVPADVIAYLQAVGIEKFLNSAGLPAGSPLTTVRGRQFARAVARVFQEGAAG